MSKPYSTAYYPTNTDLSYVELTHAQERDLFQKSRAGDEEAKEFLIRNHLLYAAMQGRKWARGALPEDEVVSAANYALMLAFERFDCARGNRFNSFLRPFVRAQIALLWRSKNVAGEHAPTFEPETLADVNVPFVDVDDFQPEDSIDHPTETNEHRAFILDLLEKSKGALTEVEAEVVRRHYGENRECLSSIAKSRKLTRERIRQIKVDALKKLRRELEKRMKSRGVQR